MQAPGLQLLQTQEEDYMLDYEKAIKNRMAEKEITFEDLEERSGYSSREIRDIVNGKIKRPYFFTIEAVLEALGLRFAIMEDD